MSEIKATIHGLGQGTCPLTDKEGDGLTVTLDDGTVTEQFLSWKGFRQLLAMKMGGGKKAPKKSEPPAALPALPVANGPQR